jgi:hypothetical protein
VCVEARWPSDIAAATLPWKSQSWNQTEWPASLSVQAIQVAQARSAWLKLTKKSRFPPGASAMAAACGCPRREQEYRPAFKGRSEGQQGRAELRAGAVAGGRPRDAVAVAHDWPADLPDEEVLKRLLELNRERAAVGR